MITFDPERLRERIAELEQELGAPGFWDDQQRAARVSAEHARLTKRLERYERLSRMSNAELARFGLTRQDIPRATVNGIKGF